MVDGFDGNLDRVCGEYEQVNRGLRTSYSPSRAELWTVCGVERLEDREVVRLGGREVGSSRPMGLSTKGGAGGFRLGRGSGRCSSLVC